MSEPQPKNAPDPASYDFVFRRMQYHPDLCPWLAEAVAGYDENQDSIDIVHPDGKRSRTAFIRSPYLRERLRKIGGWEDVTHLWKGAPPQLVDDEAPPAPKPGKAGKSIRVPG